MNTSINKEQKTTLIVKGPSIGESFLRRRTNASSSRNFRQRKNGLPQRMAEEIPVIKKSAVLQMMMGKIPDLFSFCKELQSTFIEGYSPYSALQFVPVLTAMKPLKEEEIRRFVANPKSSHILVENHLMKIILIYWKPGELSNIHGHPKDGCVFKLLHGKVEEFRYSRGKKSKLIGKYIHEKGSIAYIDDTLGFHSVSNPFSTPAISIHAYTPGKK